MPTASSLAERLLSESQDAVALQQIKERGALPMIDRGDVRQAIDRCGNIWASRALVMVGSGTGADRPDCKIQRSGRNGQRDWCMSRVTAIISALVICIIVCLSWAVNHYRDNAITYKAQRDKNARELKLANAAITDMQMRQRDVAALDAKWRLADAKAENDALRDDVAAGRRRLHIKAVCRSVREAATASGVDNAASPDWQTPLNRIISPSERLILMQKQLEEPRSILMSELLQIELPISMEQLLPVCEQYTRASGGV